MLQILILHPQYIPLEILDDARQYIRLSQVYRIIKFGTNIKFRVREQRERLQPLQIL
jgi:hypothetical protein